jgi:uncharacterized protein (DUF2062 family)
MVFKRRDKRPLLVRLREAVAPQRGWRRAIEYLGHRVRRLPDTPHRVALGFAIGVLASFTPFFGAHLLIAAGLAKLLRGNIVAALIGTFFANPLTFPLIAWMSLGLGRRILGYGASGEDFTRVSDAFADAAGGLWSSLLSLVGLGRPEWGRLGPFIDYIFWPYFVGGLLPGLVAATASYFLVRPLIAAHQARRRARQLAAVQAAENSPADGTGAPAYNRGNPAADARPEP